MPKILKTKQSPKKQNKILVCLSTVMKGFIIFAIGFLLISLIIFKVNDKSFYYYVIYLFISAGAFVTGFTSYKKLGGRGFVCGLLTSSILLQIIFCIILISNGFIFTSRMFLIVPICLISGIIGGIIGANR